MKMYDVFTTDEAKSICNNALGFDWKTGEARTKELTGTIKNNKEYYDAKELQQRILVKLLENQDLQRDWFINNLTLPRLNRYDGGDFYNLHTDAPLMGNTRTDLAYTLWLSSPNSYDGGELVIGKHSFKGKAGQMLVYNCGELHEVKPVSRGERICAIGWIQSKIKDRHKRELLSRFKYWLDSFEEMPLEGDYLYTTLYRWWL